jgi:hypothetical protein
MRRAIEARLSRRESKPLAVKDGENPEHTPQALLTHPAVTIANFHRLAGDFIPN